MRALAQTRSNPARSTIAKPAQYAAPSAAALISDLIVHAPVDDVSEVPMNRERPARNGRMLPIRKFRRIPRMTGLTWGSADIGSPLVDLARRRYTGPERRHHVSRPSRILYPLAGVGLAALAVEALALRRVRRRRVPPATSHPGVSILKPLAGHDP